MAGAISQSRERCQFPFCRPRASAARRCTWIATRSARARSRPRCACTAPSVSCAAPMEPNSAASGLTRLLQKQRRRGCAREDLAPQCCSDDAAAHKGRVARNCCRVTLLWRRTGSNLKLSTFTVSPQSILLRTSKVKTRPQCTIFRPQCTIFLTRLQPKNDQKKREKIAENTTLHQRGPLSLTSAMQTSGLYFRVSAVYHHYRCFKLTDRLL